MNLTAHTTETMANVISKFLREVILFRVHTESTPSVFFVEDGFGQEFKVTVEMVKETGD